MNKLIRSSANPEKLSLTIKGIATALLPTIMLLTGFTEADLQPIIDVIVDSAFFAAALVSTLMTLYGLLRKLYLKRWS